MTNKIIPISTEYSESWTILSQNCENHRFGVNLSRFGANIALITENKESLEE